MLRLSQNTYFISARTPISRYPQQHIPPLATPENPCLKLVVGAAIVDSLACPTRLLAAQRSYPESLAGFWSSQAGAAGESPEEGLQREISEELSTSLVLGARISSSDNGDWPLPNGSNMRLWLAAVADGASGLN